MNQNKKVLKASAGTGKTYRIAIEFIASLLNGEKYDQILIMTFTKKATAEIRARVFRFLEIIINNEQDRDNLLKSIKEKHPDTEINEDLLKDAYYNMCLNKDRLKIYTIDGFTNLLFKKAIAPYLNIYNYDMVDESFNEDIYAKIFQDILSKDEIFNLMKQFLLTHMKKDIDDYISIIKSLLMERWKFLMINRIKKPKKPVSDYIQMMDEMIIKIKEAMAIKKPDSPLIDGLKKDFKGYLSHRDYAMKKKFIDDNSTKFIKSDNFWAATSVKPTNKINTSEFYDSLINIFDDFKIALSNNLYNEKILPYEEGLLNLTDYIFEHYDKIKFSNKQFTHGDISTYSFKYFYDDKLGLIKDNIPTNSFYEIIGAPLTTVFIDEFQDTSILQWKILKPIIDNAKNVICVGDAKQSIYGWRGGEKALFEKLEIIIGGVEESMDTSYRSKTGIIHFVNRFFNGIDEGWDYNDVKSIKDGGFIQTNLEYKDSDYDAYDMIAEELCPINGKVKNYGHVGIVARTKKDLAIIGDKLKEKGVPFSSNDGGIIINHRAVKPIYQLLRYLQYNEYFYLLEFLRSDLIYINDMELKNVINDKEKIENYFNNKEHIVEIPNFNIIKKVKQIKDYYNKRSINNNDLGKKIIDDFGIDKRFNDNADIKNIYKFYSLMKKYDDILSLLNFIDENREIEALKELSAKELKAVSLMTIHKSKGLEFETEFLYWKLNKRSMPDLGFKFYITLSDDYNEILDYLIMDAKYNSILPTLELDYNEKQKYKEHMEEINNLYVAITRPETNFFIALNTGVEEEKIDDKDDAILRSLTRAMGTPDNHSLDNANTGFFKENIKEIIQKENNLDFDFIPYLRETLYDDSKINELKQIKKSQINLDFLGMDKIEKGKLIHRFLEFIKNNKKEEINYGKKVIYNEFSQIFSKDEMDDLIKKADNFINDNLWIFHEKYKIFNELSIYDKDGNKNIIDRLMIDDEKKIAYIIDYKTGMFNKEQLIRYVTLLNNYLNNYEIKSFFLKIDI